ncbi:DUF4352 domain-containing protein [Geodermatophilus sp. SYSU D01176]
MSQSTHAPADPQGYAPQPPAPAKKPFYKRAWFIVLAVLVVIAIATQGGGGDGESTTATGDPATGDAAAAPAVDTPAAEAPAPEAPGIGEPAADGKFNFVVNGVDCSVTEIGSEFLSQKAQGQFCIVDLTITNIGDQAQSFFGDNATLFNGQGQQFSADGEAAMYLEDSSSLYEEINPGNTLASKVVFDVPAGTVPTSIELHDSAFSGGVTVALQ